MILDSPLNKAGKVKEIYVHTAKNVLIQVNPKVVIGRGGVEGMHVENSHKEGQRPAGFLCIWYLCQPA